MTTGVAARIVFMQQIKTICKKVMPIISKSSYSQSETVLEAKKVKYLIVTQRNPMIPSSAVSVILHNLLKGQPFEKYCICYLDRARKREETGEQQVINVKPLMSKDILIHVIGIFFRGIKVRYAVRKVTRLIDEVRPEVVIGVYPTIMSLEVAVRACENTSLPFVPWLHDTVVEGLSSTIFKNRAQEVQDRVFKSAHILMTMSRGLNDLISSKYGVRADVLPHIYPERVLDEPVYERNSNAFWGGSIYEINDKAFERVRRVLESSAIKFDVSRLAHQSGPSHPSFKVRSYPTRPLYIDAVQRSGVVLLALNWPDECDVHKDELRTIFPTKIIEYLATGSPIVAHCPEHYFLAQFIRQNNCGIVVSSRDESALSVAISSALEHGPDIMKIQRNALIAAHQFERKRVQEKLDQICQVAIADHLNASKP